MGSVVEGARNVTEVGTMDGASARQQQQQPGEPTTNLGSSVNCFSGRNIGIHYHGSTKKRHALRLLGRQHTFGKRLADPSALNSSLISLWGSRDPLPLSCPPVADYTCPAGIRDTLPDDFPEAG